MTGDKNRFEVGYKEMKNLIHNELNITKDDIESMIKKATKNEVEDFFRKKDNNLESIIQKVVKEELELAMHQNKFPKVRGNFIDYRNPGKLSEYLASVAQHKMEEIVAQKFDVNVKIDVHNK